MEINQANFQSLCLLLERENGYRINGRTSTGVMLVKDNQTSSTARRDLAKVCKHCGCHKVNCQPEAESTDPAEIYAYIG